MQKCNPNVEENRKIREKGIISGWNFHFFFLLHNSVLDNIFPIFLEINKQADDYKNSRRGWAPWPRSGRAPRDSLLIRADAWVDSCEVTHYNCPPWMHTVKDLQLVLFVCFAALPLLHPYSAIYAPRGHRTETRFCRQKTPHPRSQWQSLSVPRRQRLLSQRCPAWGACVAAAENAESLLCKAEGKMWLMTSYVA